jgi:hypothetical protein
VDNGDGTVTDRQLNLMWKQSDAFQDTGKFTNWFESRLYIMDLNTRKFAGYQDWRFPTLEEAESLYDETAAIRDVDRFEIFIDPSFAPGGGFTTWTGNELPFDNVPVFYYRYGHSNHVRKDDFTKDTVRPVRAIS